MTRSVLLDTGPLLALIDARDRQHDWVRSQFTAIEPALLTCEPVLTEACFLAQRELGRTDAVWGLLVHVEPHRAQSLADGLVATDLQNGAVRRERKRIRPDRTHD